MYLRTPSTPGVLSRSILFQKVVMLHIKLEENGVRSTMQAHILSLHTPSVPGAESKVKTFFFLKVVIVHIELKEMTQATISQDPSPPSRSWVWVQT